MKFMDKRYNYAWNVSSFFITLLIGVSKSYEFYTSTALETKITSGEKLLIFSDDFGFGFLKKQIRLQETKKAHKTWKLIKRITSRVLVTRLWFRAEEIIQCNTIQNLVLKIKTLHGPGQSFIVDVTIILGVKYHVVIWKIILMFKTIHVCYKPEVIKQLASVIRTKGSIMVISFHFK